jgi:hypothetical protein
MRCAGSLGWPDWQRSSSTSAYSIAINAIYADQLPTHLARTSLLYAHHVHVQPPTSISTAGAGSTFTNSAGWINLLADMWPMAT